MDFQIIKHAVEAKFNEMSKQRLFRVDIPRRDVLNEKEEVVIRGMSGEYLRAFPPGTNPIFRKRTEHDCACCLGAIRAVGNAVVISGYKLVSVWDVQVSDPDWQAVADHMAAFVKSQPIADLFLHNQDVPAGADKNFEETVNGTLTWNHFKFRIPKQYMKSGPDIASALSEPRMLVGVFYRGLTELSVDTLETVIDLCAQNSLYRSRENLPVLKQFLELKNQCDKLPEELRMNYAWAHAQDVSVPVAKIRNTALGTLLKDLEAGDDLEKAVNKFEHDIMAPSNFQRPTALVSPQQVKKAKEKIEELGLTPALNRRYAVLEDIKVNNTLFVNRNTRRALEGDVFDTLAADAKRPGLPKNFDQVVDIQIEHFIKEVLPRAESVEVFLENRHAGNFVSLIAPQDPNAPVMFKWGNPFSWAYTGDVADSIKERVKAAGGSVEGDLCCRLAWDYTDDLDFHMQEPNGGHIFFRGRSGGGNGGMLDVDANGMDGPRENPVENIFYANKRNMREGDYTLIVHNYRHDGNGGQGFEVEIEFEGTKLNIAYPKRVKQGEYITAAIIRYSKTEGFKVIESLPSSAVSRKVWSLDTNQFHPVNIMMLSPNYWDGQSEVGNRHFFFMLEGCRNEGQARGFFNEYLTPALLEHRKVLEMVGSKLKVAESERQLSGLGFSDTKRNSVRVRVKGSTSRVLNVVF